MKSTNILPEGYEKIYSVDLQKNKKMLFGINGAAVFIVLAMIIPVHFCIPVTTLFDMEKGLGLYMLRLGALMSGYVLYIILHELVHGIAMKLCGTKKVKYGFKSVYAFAGSDDFYAKKPYIFIALAPVVLWGVVLFVINLFVSNDWFWVVYFIQIGNISGAAGDFFVTLKFSRMPADILVKDYGVGMEVYSKSSLR